MEIMLCKAFSGEITRVVADNEVQLSTLMPIMANSIGLYSSRDEDFGMYNLTQDFEYSPNDSLGSRETKSGDLLVIAPASNCGGCRER